MAHNNDDDRGRPRRSRSGGEQSIASRLADLPDDYDDELVNRTELATDVTVPPLVRQILLLVMATMRNNFSALVSTSERVKRIESDVEALKSGSTPPGLKPFHVGYLCEELADVYSSTEVTLSICIPAGASM